MIRYLERISKASELFGQFSAREGFYEVSHGYGDEIAAMLLIARLREEELANSKGAHPVVGKRVLERACEIMMIQEDPVATVYFTQGLGAVVRRAIYDSQLPYKGKLAVKEWDGMELPMVQICSHDEQKNLEVSQLLRDSLNFGRVSFTTAKRCK